MKKDPRFSSLVGRIGGKRTDAWNIHYAALDALDRGEDVIVLSVGDPDFATPDCITERAVEALRGGDTHYSDVPGRVELRSAIARMHQEDCGQPVGEDNVIVVGGAQNGLFATALCLCEAGDEVLVPEPMYLTYEASIRASGATLVPVPVDAEHGFHLDPNAVAAAITPRTRAIFLATPGNPTGVVMTRAELEGIAEIARLHNLWVVSDEVYAGLTFERPHISIASLPGMAERTVTIGSLSKSHAMPGWRLGWVIGPEDLIAHMGKLALCMLYGLPGFIQEAALVALAERADIVTQMRDTYRRRRDVTYQLLQGIPGIRCLLPEAGMFMLIDVRATGLSANEFAWGLFEQARVSVLDATAFGDSARGFLRLGFVVDEERLAEACRRIAGYVASLETVAA
ncbi:aminotransferase class I/II-fold pyridoxal phosphate-dependent enzyme [Crenobacter sp. SG2305]|uniref:pyridoxal phosphate-dependent aminotransferase n=1 Tax=Crenobacter oryzisoli TaxID=3056844 RepID=UPI0025AAAD3D|nr:aminotransferase class I/II-fold pyridoxal phosphate-dependent enzyme [Crenobacter sp. SG2305]MDN0084190.1 aminotransferase class I/II-fold pyridoxal phosphate-dependent enzyme [Crenobacter sp. SG2305]